MKEYEMMTTLHCAGATARYCKNIEMRVLKSRRNTVMPEYIELNSRGHNFPTGTNNISEGVKYQAEEGLASLRKRKKEWLWPALIVKMGCTIMVSSQLIFLKCS